MQDSRALYKKMWRVLVSTLFALGATGAADATGSMATARVQNTATTLADGTVLVVGGGNSSGMPLASAEIYDPVTGAFSPTGSLTAPRRAHTATATYRRDCVGDRWGW